MLNITKILRPVDFPNPSLPVIGRPKEFATLLCNIHRRAACARCNFSSHWFTPLLSDPTLFDSQRPRAALGRGAALKLEGKMRRTEGPRKVSRVEDLSRGDHTRGLRQPFGYAFGRFHHNGYSDRVDVSPARYGSARFTSSFRDHVHNEDLRRASALGHRRRRRRFGIADVKKWRDIDVRALSQASADAVR
jgi:hypothetical protein